MDEREYLDNVIYDIVLGDHLKDIENFYRKLFKIYDKVKDFPDDAFCDEHGVYKESDRGWLLDELTNGIKNKLLCDIIKDVVDFVQYRYMVKPTDGKEYLDVNSIEAITKDGEHYVYADGGWKKAAR